MYNTYNTYVHNRGGKPLKLGGEVQHRNVHFERESRGYVVSGVELFGFRM